MLLPMKEKRDLTEADLAALAKKSRESAGKTRAEAAREMGVKHPSIFHAEESPDKSFFKLRKRLIETYSPYRVRGPVFFLAKKS
jgi:DNA-binding XRE family transcriptional regulator